MTKTAGKTWGDITDNLTDSVSSIIINVYQVYAATNGGGLWSRNLGDFTGIDNRVQNSLVSIFPNPATDKVILSLNESETNTFRVELINLSGQVVISKSYQAQKGKDKVQLDCSQLAPGLYSIRILTDNTSIIKKLVIQ